MNNPRSQLALWLGCTLSAVALLAPGTVLAVEVKVVSPDKQLEFELSGRDPARLTYEINFRGKSVLDPSSLKMSVDGADLSQGTDIGDAKRYTIDEKYDVLGIHSQAVNHCNGATIALSHGQSNTDYTLEVRVFNDAVAYRHVIPGDAQQQRVPDEACTFVIPAGSATWSHDLEGHYEAVHSKKDIREHKEGQWVGPPLSFKLPGGAGYASISEAALINYAGMALLANGERGFVGRLGHSHPPSFPYRRRYSAEDQARVAQPASVTGTITTPWRVVMVGADLNTLVNCDALTNLTPPPDKRLFPQGVHTNWIKPGRAVWRYLDGGDRTPEAVKELSRLAGQLGWEYQIVEGMWARFSDEERHDIVKYSKEQGVGLWFWKHSRSLRTPEERKDFFKFCSDLGVVGVKIDFFDHEAKEVIDLYQAMLKEAAEHKILVDFHGANKPTGETRMWPNELTREAVRGLEGSRMFDRATFNSTLPFTRLLAGHAEYTPMLFTARRSNTTWTHQIGTAAMFASPLLTVAAHPANILDNPAVEVIKNIPPVWDETRVLPPSEIGELAIEARRTGNAWFLVVLNNPTPRKIEVPLSFLGAGRYDALLVRDNAEDSGSLRVEPMSTSKTETLKIDLAEGGGFVGRFTPVK